MNMILGNFWIFLLNFRVLLILCCQLCKKVQTKVLQLNLVEILHSDAVQKLCCQSGSYSENDG